MVIEIDNPNPSRESLSEIVDKLILFLGVDGCQG